MAAGHPFSFTAHAKDIFVDSLDWEWLAWLGAKAHAVITVCDYNRRYLRRRMPDARVVRIYNGVDLERWALPARRARPARPANGPVVTVGRFVRKKGFDVLVAALGIAARARLPLRAVLIGAGAEWDAVRSLAREQRLGRRVRFPGALTQPRCAEVLASASLVVLPCVVDRDGNQDALPTVLLEASACGLPCVATRVGGVPEIVQDGVTGRVVAPETPARWPMRSPRSWPRPAAARGWGSRPAGAPSGCSTSAAPRRRSRGCSPRPVARRVPQSFPRRLPMRIALLCSDLGSPSAGERRVRPSARGRERAPAVRGIT
jgi:glycosyltransferase involved in cell wall biosynthesis